MVRPDPHSKADAYAIFNMKKYLCLGPDTDEARKLKDKIYEWELYLK